MEGKNQDGNSERAGNGAIVGSGISQIKTTEKKQKTEKVIFIVKVTLKYLLYLLINNHHLR